MANSIESALLCYNALNTAAMQRGVCNWRQLPKFHMLTHMAFDNAALANPRRVHVYADEDMVGIFVDITSLVFTAPRRA